MKDTLAGLIMAVAESGFVTRCEVPVIADAEQRFRSILNALNEAKEWALDAEQQAYYLRMALKLVPEASSEKLVQVFFTNFHLDHDLVESLRFVFHPQHEQHWQDWSTRVVIILRHKNLSWSRDTAIAEEDLAQVAREELLLSLADFGYRSRFSTWAYHVVTRAAQRCIRDLNAKKRNGNVEHLEQVYEQAVMVADDAATITLALEIVMCTEVDQLLCERLGPQPANVFRLFAQEDLSLQQIAERCHLSLSQVQNMLRDARRVLRKHPGILLWRE